MLQGTAMLIVDLLILLTFALAAYLGFSLVGKLYGGRFTNALPYLIIGVVLMFAMPLLHFLENVYPILQGSANFAHTLQLLQLVAGIFFIMALYQIYQARFMTEGFIGGGK